MAECERQLVQRYRAQLADVERLVAGGQLPEAMTALRVVLSAERRACLEDVRTAAAAMLEQVLAKRDQMQRQCAVHTQRARELIEMCRHDQAVQELELIPERLRDDPVRGLLAQAVGRQEEIARLRQLVGTTAVDLAERMQSLERLTVLLPSDDQVKRWATQVPGQIQQSARELLQRQEYGRAAGLLSSIPARFADASVSSLLKQAVELEYLASEVELAPQVTPVTLEAARRLAKLDPDNKTLAAVRME